tara:strand:- start:698 stop:949 length:252 start_codon:yes stop_codon:yes gene_type:complete
MNDPEWKETVGKKRAEKIRKSKLGKKRSNQTKEKIRAFMLSEDNPLRGKPKNFKKIECPHCKRFIGVNNAKRYHFDNCKLLIN